MTPITAIDQATEFWSSYGPGHQQRLDAALALIEWPEFDAEMVHEITGIEVQGFRESPGVKSKLNAETLPMIQRIAHSKRRAEPTDWDTVRIIVEAGTSISTLCSLSGLSRGWVSRKLRHLQGTPFSEMDSVIRSRAKS